MIYCTQLRRPAADRASAQGKPDIVQRHLLNQIYLNSRSQAADTGWAQGNGRACSCFTQTQPTLPAFSFDWDLTSRRSWILFSCCSNHDYSSEKHGDVFLSLLSLAYVLSTAFCKAQSGQRRVSLEFHEMWPRPKRGKTLVVGILSASPNGTCGVSSLHIQGNLILQIHIAWLLNWNRRQKCKFIRGTSIFDEFWSKLA